VCSLLLPDPVWDLTSGRAPLAGQNPDGTFRRRGLIAARMARKTRASWQFVRRDLAAKAAAELS
jgi:hypothetical protein